MQQLCSTIIITKTGVSHSTIYVGGVESKWNRSVYLGMVRSSLTKPPLLRLPILFNVSTNQILIQVPLAAGIHRFTEWAVSTIDSQSTYRKKKKKEEELDWKSFLEDYCCCCGNLLISFESILEPDKKGGQNKL